MTATIKRCVLGHDISYTLSPRLHAVISRVLGERATYGVEDIPPERLASELPRLFSEYDGFNVTKPHKESVAKLLGSPFPVNTVRRDGACTSTDAQGFLSDYTHAFGAPHGNILLLGAGGAAKSVAQALSAGRDVRVFVHNRTYQKAKQMESERIAAVQNASGKFDAVINAATPANGVSHIPRELNFRGVRYAYDLVYSPPETEFLRRAKAAGASVCGGLGMLIRQAIAAHEFWRGAPFDSDTIQALYRAAIAELAQGTAGQ